MPEAEETIRREVVFDVALLERVEAAIPEGGNRSQLVNDLVTEALDAREAGGGARPVAARTPGVRQVWPPTG
jgi:hypothetical protein